MVFGFPTSLYSLVFHSLILATISMYPFGLGKSVVGSDGHDHDRSDYGSHDRACSSNRVIDHDCGLGLLEHDPVIEEWVTCEYRVACHYY